MFKKLAVSLSLLIVLSTLAVHGAKQAPPQAIAFVNVNVVPFDRERILPAQTVVVRDGRIAEIGPAEKTKVPAGALQIDGRGNFAEVMKTPRHFGTVEVGLRADLILLDANPLQSVANASKRAGVMLRGRWLPESELREMLENIAILNKGITQ